MRFGIFRTRYRASGTSPRRAWKRGQMSLQGKTRKLRACKTGTIWN